jgi:plastocyanin
MRSIALVAGLMTGVGLVTASVVPPTVAADVKGSDDRQIVLRDDCDPTDPGWIPTGGCNLPEGDVDLAEFNAYRLSSLAPSVIGHSAWWFDPGYLKVSAGKRIKIANAGGRTHTFTEVANFGGGRVPPLNAGQPGTAALTPAPECLAPGVIDLPGGARDVVDGLASGDHRFQCCIHPWMRTLVKVGED